MQQGHAAATRARHRLYETYFEVLSAVLCLEVRNFAAAKTRKKPSLMTRGVGHFSS